MRDNVIISIGSFNAALAIGLGAFAAHGLKQHLDARSLAIFNTATDFHFWHALGLILVGLMAKNMPQQNFSIPAWLMIAGILLFCGSLYTLAGTGIAWLGAITPLGGVSFILAWMWLAWRVLRQQT